MHPENGKSWLKIAESIDHQMANIHMDWNLTKKGFKKSIGGGQAIVVIIYLQTNLSVLSSGEQQGNSSVLKIT